jgi:hypothetical protein
MSNIVPTNIQLPAHLAGRQGSALSTAIVGGISGGESVPRISIKASRFRLVEDGTETIVPTTYIDAIIVGANPNLTKTWYEVSWSPDNEPTAPDCQSFDGIRPSPDAASPQSDLCVTCPHNVWGSRTGLQGQKLKACTDSKRLAIVAADDPSGTVYLLAVTPAALKGLNAYHRELSVRGIAPEVVRTRISFDTDASFPKLMFKFAGFIDEQTLAVVDELVGSDAVCRITAEDAPIAQAPAPAPLPTPKRPVQVHPAPQRPMQEVLPLEEPAPAPVQAAPAKRGFGAVAQPAAAPVQAAPAKRGFGAAAPAQAAPVQAAPAPAARRPGRPPKTAPVATAPAEAAGGDLANEISAMLAEIGEGDDV